MLQACDYKAFQNAAEEDIECMKLLWKWTEHDKKLQLKMLKSMSYVYNVNEECKKLFLEYAKIDEKVLNDVRSAFTKK